MAIEAQSHVRSMDNSRAVGSTPKLVRSDSWLDSIDANFDRELWRRNLSAQTVRSYKIGIKNFFNFLRAQGVDDLHYLNRDLLERWQDSLLERVPPLRAGSRSLYGHAVRLLIRWASEHGIVEGRLETAMVTVKKRHNSNPRPLPPEALATIRAFLVPLRPRMTALELRDRAMFHYLLTSGARVSEALQVTRKDFEGAVVRQKGGSDKQLFIPPTVVTMVHEYLSARKDDLPWLWVTHGNNGELVRRLESSGVREVWRRLCYRLNLERFTTHQLRHSCATEMLDAGVGAVAVAEHLGHHDLGTLPAYGQVRGRQRQQALDAMEKLAEPSDTPAPGNRPLQLVAEAQLEHVSDTRAPTRSRARGSVLEGSPTPGLATPEQVLEAVRLGVITKPEARRLLGFVDNTEPSATAAVPDSPPAGPALPHTPRQKRVPHWFDFVVSLWASSVQPRRPHKQALAWMRQRIARARLSKPCELARVVTVWDEAFSKSAKALGTKTHIGLVWMVPSFVEWAGSPAPGSAANSTWDWAVGLWEAGQDRAEPGLSRINSEGATR